MNKGNAKSQFSKQEIFNALLELMNTTDYDEISISQISKKAQVSRNTFYRNFKSKQDVLRLKTEEMAQNYIENHKKLNQLSGQSITLILFEIIINDIEFTRILVKYKLLYLLTDDLFTRVVSENINNRKQFWEKYSRDQLHQLLSFTFGGFERFVAEQIINDSNPTALNWCNKFNGILDIITHFI